MIVTTVVSITPTEEEYHAIEAFANFLDEFGNKIECYDHNADQEKAECTLRALRQGLEDLEDLLYQLANDDNIGVIRV